MHFVKIGPHLCFGQINFQVKMVCMTRLHHIILWPCSLFNSWYVPSGVYDMLTWRCWQKSSVASFTRLSILQRHVLWQGFTEAEAGVEDQGPTPSTCEWGGPSFTPKSKPAGWDCTQLLIWMTPQPPLSRHTLFRHYQTNKWQKKLAKPGPR